MHTLSELANTRARQTGLERPTEIIVTDPAADADSKIMVRVDGQMMKRGPVAWCSNGRLPQPGDQGMLITGAREAVALVWATGPLIVGAV